MQTYLRKVKEINQMNFTPVETYECIYTKCIPENNMTYFNLLKAETALRGRCVDHKEQRNKEELKRP